MKFGPNKIKLTIFINFANKEYTICQNHNSILRYNVEFNKLQQTHWRKISAKSKFTINPVLWQACQKGKRNETKIENCWARSALVHLCQKEKITCSQWYFLMLLL